MKCLLLLLFTNPAFATLNGCNERAVSYKEAKECVFKYSDDLQNIEIYALLNELDLEYFIKCIEASKNGADRQSCEEKFGAYPE